MTACTMCIGTDAAGACALGQCRWEWEQQWAEEDAREAEYEAEAERQRSPPNAVHIAHRDGLDWNEGPPWA